MNISSAYMVILHASANFVFQCFWTWNSLDLDQVLSFTVWFCWAWSGSKLYAKLPVDKTIVDTRYFAGPDLGLNCMQNLPVDKTIVDTCDFAGPDLSLNCM